MIIRDTRQMLSKWPVSVIVPVYRSSDDVAQCLQSLRQSGELRTAEVIVVDDYSNDGTAEMIERDFPEVLLIRHCTNGGFARAINTGVTKVPADCEFIALLNSDTIVEPGWLDLAVEVLRRDKRVGAVAPRVVLHDNPSVIDSAGQGYTISGWAYRRGCGQRYGPPFDSCEPVFGPTGSAVIFRREALDEQPYVFREDLQCYYEDTELAFRLQLAGWICLYHPQSVVRHKVSVSYGSMPAQKTYHVSRNLELIFWEYMPAGLLWRAVWDHLLLTFLHGTSKTFQRQGLAYLKGKLAFLAHAAETRRRRRQRANGEDIAEWIERPWLGQVMSKRCR